MTKVPRRLAEAAADALAEFPWLGLEFCIWVQLLEFLVEKGFGKPAAEAGVDLLVQSRRLRIVSDSIASFPPDMFPPGTPAKVKRL